MSDWKTGDRVQVRTEAGIHAKHHGQIGTITRECGCTDKDQCVHQPYPDNLGMLLVRYDNQLRGEPWVVIIHEKHVNRLPVHIEEDPL